MLLVVFDMVYNSVSLAIRLIYIFFLSIHHDWIDPLLRRYDQEHAIAQRAAEAIEQIREREQQINEQNA